MDLTTAIVRNAYSPDVAKALNAREAIKSATRKQREKVCPVGLTGNARKRFITEGLLGTEQVAEAKATREAHEALEAQNPTTTKEHTVSKNTKTAKNTKTGRTSAQVARDAGIDGRRFRAFLREQGIDRTFPTKAKANSAVRRFTKAQDKVAAK